MFDSAHGKLAYKCVLANIISKIIDFAIAEVQPIFTRACPE
jgi:hypothetical protein